MRHSKKSKAAENGARPKSEDIAALTGTKSITGHYVTIDTLTPAAIDNLGAWYLQCAADFNPRQRTDSEYFVLDITGVPAESVDLNRILCAELIAWHVTLLVVGYKNKSTGLYDKHFAVLGTKEEAVRYMKEGRKPLRFLKK